VRSGKDRQASPVARVIERTAYSPRDARAVAPRLRGYCGVADVGWKTDSPTARTAFSRFSLAACGVPSDPRRFARPHTGRLQPGSSLRLV
jgi:hypothetical protein